MKVVIIGANGQLGSDLVESFSRQHETFSLNHADLEVTDIDHVKRVLTSIMPDLVINTSAYHNVPLCEQNPDLAFAVNGKGVLNLAKVTSDMNVRLVHFSTDYVFNGVKKKPYAESDPCEPLNVYGATKLAGENFALSYADRPCVIRVSGIYGAVPCRAKGGNFVTTMLKLAKEKPEVRVVEDEILTPTPTAAIAENTLQLVTREEYGLYHMTCEGQCSWYEFAKAIWEVMGLTTPLYPASVNDFPLTVKRPFYSVLDNLHLDKIGLNYMPGWKEALIKFLKQRD